LTDCPGRGRGDRYDGRDQLGGRGLPDGHGRDPTPGSPPGRAGGWDGGRPGAGRLDRGAEIPWVQDGTHHVHTTHCPERFVKELDLDAITGLTITRPTLEETYLSLVSSKEPQS